LSSTCPEPGKRAQRTLIVAHRGASGYLPEHTAAAKVLGYGQGADLLEQDVVATRDGELVVLHDIWLDDVSDVAARFPGRQRVDGHFYVIDFTRAELAEISLEERRRPGTRDLLYPGRFPSSSQLFRITSLEDEIRLIAGLNRSTGRKVGIYPEIKEPRWHRQAGIDLTRLVHDALMRSREMLAGPLFLQSFDSDVLRRLHEEFATPWPLVQLLSRERAESLTTDERSLREIAALAAAVGLPYTTLLWIDGGGRIGATPLAQMIIDAGLALHPYTLRRDAPQLRGISYRDALEFLIEELAVEALFCDFPDDAVAIRDGSAA
jgi:glycerophosphoryl diester phosphodiesterase